MRDTNNETTACTLTTTEDESTRAADVAAAEALVVEWATSIIPLGRNIHKMVHTERLCREAVASGMMRVRLGSNPAIIHVRLISRFLIFSDVRTKCEQGTEPRTYVGQATAVLRT